MICVFDRRGDFQERNSCMYRESTLNRFVNDNSVGSEVVTALVMKSSVFFAITACSMLKVSRRFGGTCPVGLQGQRINQARKKRKAMVYCLVYSSALNMEATCSSEMSVDFQRTTLLYIPEDRILRKVTSFSVNVFLNLLIFLLFSANVMNSL
jgi:hypothetical protein